MVQNVFRFDQSDYIEGSAALAGCAEGACLAFSMKWVQNKLVGRGDYLSLVDTETKKAELAGWMKKCQSDILNRLFGDNKFKYTNTLNQPISDANAVRGQINNMQAYAHRLEAMSLWGRELGLTLIDDRAGFPHGNTDSRELDKNWASSLVNFSCRNISPPVAGVISLTGNDDGHALAYELTVNRKVNYFDPNEGEYSTNSADEFHAWLQHCCRRNYPNLNQQWWVVAFSA